MEQLEKTWNGSVREALFYGNNYSLVLNAKSKQQHNLSDV